jgi:hypothetical protein
VVKNAKVALPLAPLPALVQWLQGIPSLVIGGLAVALLGRPRLTRDIDVLVLLPEARWPAFLDAGLRLGFVPRFPDPLEFAREARVLLVRHGPSGIDIDIALGALPFEEEAIARATLVQIEGVSLPVPTPEDLVIMKAVAHRERDQLDVAGLLSAHPQLDVRRVRRWVRIFADALDTPELLEDLNRMLGKRGHGRRGKRKP